MGVIEEYIEEYKREIEKELYERAEKINERLFNKYVHKDYELYKKKFDELKSDYDNARHFYPLVKLMQKHGIRFYEAGEKVMWLSRPEPVAPVLIPSLTDMVKEFGNPEEYDMELLKIVEDETVRVLKKFFNEVMAPKDIIEAYFEKETRLDERARKTRELLKKEEEIKKRIRELYDWFIENVALKLFRHEELVSLYKGKYFGNYNFPEWGGYELLEDEHFPKVIQRWRELKEQGILEEVYRVGGLEEYIKKKKEEEEMKKRKQEEWEELLRFYQEYLKKEKEKKKKEVESGIEEEKSNDNKKAEKEKEESLLKKIFSGIVNLLS